MKIQYWLFALLLFFALVAVLPDGYLYWSVESEELPQEVGAGLPLQQELPQELMDLHPQPLLHIRRVLLFDFSALDPASATPASTGTGSNYSDEGASPPQ